MRFVYGKVKPIRTPADLDAAPQGPEEAPSRKRKLAAILHADVVGFSRLMGEDETGTHQALGRLRRAVDPLIAARGGRIVGTAGDSLLADFPSVVDALNCALDMQRASRAINDPMPPERRLELRIGVNLGDVIIDGDDIFGDGVNIAARIEALAKPGSVCISHTVYEQVKNKLDLDYRPLGSHRVKNIAEPVRAYEVGGRAAASRPRRRRWPMAAAAGVAAIVSAGLVAWALHAGGGRDLFGLGSAAKPVDVASLAAPARLAGRPSVAVLPFKNLSGDAGHDFFSDGITEDVITALGRFSNLLVISKSATFPFKNSNASPAEIGRLLNARYLLDGSIRRAGNRVRVGVALTEPTTGRNVWSETYDVEGDDIFTVQDNIARRVVGAAAVSSPASSRSAFWRNPPATSRRTSTFCAAVMHSRMIRVTATTRQASSSSVPSISIPTTPTPMRHWATRITRPSFRDGPNSARKNSSARKRSPKRLWHWIRQRRALIACSPNSIFTGNASISRSRKSTARSKSIRAMRTTMPPAGASWYGRARPRRHCRGWRARFALTRPTALQPHGSAWRITCFAGIPRPSMPATVPFPATRDATPRCSRIRCLRPPMPNWADSRMPSGSAPSPRAYGHSSDARTFADQFGTDEARDHMLEGLKKAGFR